MDLTKRVQREPTLPGPLAPEFLCTLRGGQIAKRPIRRAILMLVLLFAGCTSFDASDAGDTVEVLLGKTFTISLPAAKEPRSLRVENLEVARFVGCRADHPEATVVYEFATKGLGETKIHIFGDPPLPDGKEFIMTVRVVIGGSPHY